MPRRGRAEGEPNAAPRRKEEPTRRCPHCGTKYPLDYVVCPKDRTALERPDAGDDPLIGEVLAGSFCVTGLIGEGAMGKVYEAEHTRLPRRFAIKVMHEELVRFPEALARVEREGQAIARVASDNVIDVIDVVRLEDGRPCLVTELLEGDELGALLDKKGKLPLNDAISIARQVCRGLAAAHAVGVLHRDLKPTNLFLAKRGESKPVAKILDFGVAKMSDGAQLTLTGMVLGTPAYMAPEQARGDKDVDERADVYSLGAVLYHMLTGSPPFVADDPAVLLTRVMGEDPPSLRTIDPTIPEAIDKLVMRALARSRNARPRTVADFELDLAMVDPDEIERAELAARPEVAPARPAPLVRERDTVVDAPSGASEAPAPRSAGVATAFVLLGIAGTLVLAGIEYFANPRSRPGPGELGAIWSAGLVVGVGVALFVTLGRKR